MQVNTKQTLKDFKGKEVVDSETKNPITIGEVITNTLSFAKMSKNPYKAYSLAAKFAKDKTVDVTSEDITFIKDAITENPILSVMISGQVIAILEGNISQEKENHDSKSDK